MAVLTLKSGIYKLCFIYWLHKQINKSDNTSDKPYLDYLIDKKFKKVNRLFVLSFENNSYITMPTKYYFATVKIKNYNVMIDGKENMTTFEKLWLVKAV